MDIGIVRELLTNMFFMKNCFLWNQQENSNIFGASLNLSHEEKKNLYMQTVAFDQGHDFPLSCSQLCLKQEKTQLENVLVDVQDGSPIMCPTTLPFPFVSLTDLKICICLGSVSADARTYKSAFIQQLPTCLWSRWRIFSTY